MMNLAKFVLLLTLFSCPALSVDLLKAKQSDLFESRICFFPGSFDPFHQGHFSIIEHSLKKNCDYVLIYPSWGGDKFKPNRSPFHQRIASLKKIYENHPKVLYSEMTPMELFEYFKNKKDFIALIGSDVAKWLRSDNEMVKEFATGQKPKINNTWGGCMAIGANSFVVFLRSDDQEFETKLLGRKIIEVVDFPKNIKEISSTQIKEIKN